MARSASLTPDQVEAIRKWLESCGLKAVVVWLA